MAKFKVGDKVKVKNIPEKIGTITAVDSDGDVKIKGVGKDYEAMWVKQEYVSKVANSALNAKFKVGDRVRGSRSGVYPTKDDVGVVVELLPDSKAVRVRSEKYGRDIDYHESDLVAANSALNAKFKVGDRVRFTAGPIKGEYGKIISLGKKSGCYDVQSAYGEILTNTPEGELAKNSSVSSNPVVQNALATTGVARNADGDPESLVNWKRIYPKLKEFNSIAGWLKGEGVKLMNVARNFDDKKFHSVGNDVQSVCEWAERKSAEILNRA